MMESQRLATNREQFESVAFDCVWKRESRFKRRVIKALYQQSSQQHVLPSGESWVRIQRVLENRGRPSTGIASHSEYISEVKLKKTTPHILKSISCSKAIQVRLGRGSYRSNATITLQSAKPNHFDSLMNVIRSMILVSTFSKKHPSLGDQRSETQHCPNQKKLMTVSYSFSSFLQLLQLLQEGTCSLSAFHTVISQKCRKNRSIIRSTV